MTVNKMTVVPSCTSDRLQLRRTVVEQLVGDDSDSIYSRIRVHLSSNQPCLAPNPTVDSIFTSLVDLLYRGPHSSVSIILRNDLLLARAKTIADAANRAEHLLEVHYASIILRSPSVRSIELDSSGNVLSSERPVLQLANATQPFPYVGNYVRLVRSECRVISACLHNDIGSIAVVGSGPLPLTGALMCAQLGARVTLVDKDETATKLATGLIALWERCGALQTGYVRTICADAKDISFTRNRSPLNRIEADVILVASLVPDEIKVALVKQIAKDNWDGIVCVRSAHGLTSVANYEKANRNQLMDFMDFIGYVVPVVCVEDDEVVGEDANPLALFPKDVLNSIELYTRCTENMCRARKMGSQVTRLCGRGILDAGADFIEMLHK